MSVAMISQSEDPRSHVLLYSRSRAGHRGTYLDFVGSLFRRRRSGPWGLLFSRHPAFFLMIEESFALYFCVAMWRSLFGWRTVGLLFRPGPTSEGASFRLRLKRLLLRMLKKMPRVQTLSIIPLSLEPCFDKIVDGWIYDFQLWDMSAADRKTYSALLTGAGDCPQDARALHDKLRAKAAGRRVVTAIGIQNRQKGFDRFAQAYDDKNLRARWLFASGGKIAPACTPDKSALNAAGGVTIDRFVSNAEILALYAAGDVIWCAYDKAYDQASGILGRAVQFGRPVIVREGSFSHKFCRTEHLPHLVLRNHENICDLLAQLPSSDEQTAAHSGEIAARRFRETSLQCLCGALNVKPAPRVRG